MMELSTFGSGRLLPNYHYVQELFFAIMTSEVFDLEGSLTYQNEEEETVYPNCTFK